MVACGGRDLETTTADDAVDPAAVQNVTETETVTEEAASSDLAEGELDADSDLASEAEAPATEGDGAVDASAAGTALALAGFEMTVTGVQRLAPGEALVHHSFGSSPAKTPQGHWIVVDVAYLNTGMAPVSPGFTFNVIRALTFSDASGSLDGQYDPDSEASQGLTDAAGQATEYDDVNPGSSLALRYAYDMPGGCRSNG